MAEVFVSWSGEPSRLVGSALRRWLPEVFQTLRPFMSDSDIPAGAVWFDTIGRSLESSDFAILCVTASNQLSPWLHFEAGAMAASHSSSSGTVPSSVMPLLLDLSPTDLRPPLSLYNCVEATEAGIRSLLASVNRYLPAKLSPTSLDSTFEKWWPDLETELEEAKKVAQSGAPAVERSEKDVLEEVLSLVRGTTLNRPVHPPHGDLALRPGVRAEFVRRVRMVTTCKPYVLRGRLNPDAFRVVLRAPRGGVPDVDEVQRLVLGIAGDMGVFIESLDIADFKESSEGPDD